MDLWQLRTFSAVAKNLHFTRAAEDLNLSQPAVSQQIKALEKEIGEPLFLRGKDEVSLTKAGETMYAHAIKILDIAAELSIDLLNGKDSLNGKIVICTSTFGLNNNFSVLYKAFTEKYRDIELLFQIEESFETIVENVRIGKIDLGILGKIPDLRGLNELSFGYFNFVLVAGKDHALANKEKVTADDLKNEEWIMLESSSRLRVWAEEALAEAGIPLGKVWETNDGSVITPMLATGNKISILPKWGVIEDIKQGNIVELNFQELTYTVEAFCIWNKNSHKKSITAFLNHLLETKLEGVELAK